jgi:hypothetical protein
MFHSDGSSIIRNPTFELCSGSKLQLRHYLEEVPQMYYSASHFTAVRGRDWTRAAAAAAANTKPLFRLSHTKINIIPILHSLCFQHLGPQILKKIQNKKIAIYNIFKNRLQ